MLLRMFASVLNYNEWSQNHERSRRLESMLVSVLIIFMASSTPAATVPIRVNLPGARVVTWFQWLGPHKLIALYSTASDDRAKIRIYDTVANSVFEPQFEYDVSSIEHYTNVCWRMSPDGKLLMGYHGKRIITCLDGRHHINLPAFGIDVRWSQDSQSYAECEQGASTEIRVTTLTTGLHRKSAYNYRFQGDVGSVIGLTGKKEPILLKTGFPLSTINIVQRGKGKPTIVGHSLNIPRCVNVVDGVLSPDGRRICWLTLNGRGNDDILDSRKEKDACLFLSDLNGNNLLKIHTLDLGYSARSGYTGDRFRLSAEPNLQWSTDGRYISFIARNQICLLTAPK